MGITVNEAPAARIIVIQRLLSDTGSGGVATLTGNRIVRDVADAGAVYPFVTVSFMSSQDLLTADATHVSTDVLILVKVVDKGPSDAALQTIARRVFERIDQYEGVVYGGQYATKFRRTEQPMQPDDFVSGIRYSYANQVFKVEIEAA